MSLSSAMLSLPAVSHTAVCFFLPYLFGFLVLVSFALLYCSLLRNVSQITLLQDRIITLFKKTALFPGCLCIIYKLPIQIYHKKTFSIIKPGYFINLIFRTGKGDSAEKQYIYIPAKLELPETADIAIKTFPW